MKIVILGGNGPWHYDWIRQLGGYLEANGHEVLLHDYRHWTTGEDVADIDDELQRLETLLKDEKDYVVVSKSIGTVITVLGVARGTLHPVRCVLLGVPYDGIAGQTSGFDKSLRQLPKTTVIQNDHDPFGSADMITKVVDEAYNPNITLVITPGDTHDYLDFALITKQLTAK